MKRLLVIDGYNYIFYNLKGKKVNSQRLGFLRENLIGYLEQYSGLTGLEVIAVFDSSDDNGPRDSVTKGNVRVIYSGKHSADSIIEKIAAREHDKREIFVVTSDYIQQKTVLKKNIYRKSVREFNLELSRIVEDMREDIKKISSKSSRSFYSLSKRLGYSSRDPLKNKKK